MGGIGGMGGIGFSFFLSFCWVAAQGYLSFFLAGFVGSPKSDSSLLCFFFYLFLAGSLVCDGLVSFFLSGPPNNYFFSIPNYFYVEYQIIVLLNTSFLLIPIPRETKSQYGKPAVLNIDLMHISRPAS
jgi:hypothetical protein